MPGNMFLRVWDVEHGACAILHHSLNNVAQKLAMIDSGDTAYWTPSTFIRRSMNRTQLDFLFITNADQDHMSGLQGLWDAGIAVPVWHRNPSMNAAAFQAIKRLSGPLTKDARRYLQNLTELTHPVALPFNENMGGITASMFWNTYPQFQATNDLSLVVFIRFGTFNILFPGDLEGPGWRNLLTNPSFRTALAGVDVLVASHHGRESGYCAEVFEYCKPQAIVMSDKAIVHDTQGMTQTYRNHVIRNYPSGVYVQTSSKRRHVLTTRRDGWIQFAVNETGGFDITTERNG